VLAGGAYLVLSVALWWEVWSSHPTSVSLCGCGDPALFTWFLDWPAHAITHGTDPFYSSAMFHPGGVNLLANTSEVGLGVVLAPVTWVFGPVATLNVSLTLAPVLSALAMFVLARRWVSWTPAAFVAGLLYGFSPVVVSNLTDAHLMVAMAPVPPLLVLCLDELLVRQRRRPVAVGVVLGLLVVVQFFLGTELLLICAITAAVGVVLVVAYAAVGHRDALRRHARHALVGFGTAAGVAGVLLAYPLWFVLDGPAHLSGLVWPAVPPGDFGIRLPTLVTLDPTGSETATAHRFGGYQGLGLHQADYLGVGLLLVLVAVVVLRRRDRRLWLFGSVGLLSVLLSLSAGLNDFWVPWRVLRHLPEVQNIVPDRFMVITVLCASVMLGIAVDATRRWVTVTPGIRSGRPDRNAAPSAGRRAAAGGAALVVTLIALVPIANSYVGRLPLTVGPMVVPEWFRTVAPHLPPGQVVLTYPSSFGGFLTSLTEQVDNGLSYDTVEGGGPSEVPSRLGPEASGAAALGDAALALDPAATYTPATATAVREALLGWGVTRVVVPDPSGLPSYEQGLHTSYAVALLTAATGQRPQFEADAWVWVPDTSVPAVPVDGAALRACVGTTNLPTGPPDAIPDCVLSGSGR